MIKKISISIKRAKPSFFDEEQKKEFSSYLLQEVARTYAEKLLSDNLIPVEIKQDFAGKFESMYSVQSELIVMKVEDLQKLILLAKNLHPRGNEIFKLYIKELSDDKKNKGEE